MIVFDTSFLSAVLRRSDRAAPDVRRIAVFRASLSGEREVFVPGVVFQELLTGVRTESEFDRLHRHLTALPIVPATREDHLFAAQIANRCRAAGLAGPPIDALIAAQTVLRDGELMTLDADFTRIAPHCGLKLYKV